jgi:hypothetical protein
MNTRFETDSELLDLVRRVDPMLDPRVHATAGLDTESALRLFAHKLDMPPMSRHAPRRARTAVRIAVLAAVVAAGVFVAANLTSAGNGSAVSPAQARTILRHVRAALVWPPHAIYEEDALTTVTARDGARSTSGYHEWLSTSPPYNNRAIQFKNGKVQWEQAFVGPRRDLYVPATNTVYMQPAGAQFCEVHPTTAQSASGSCQVPDNPDWNSALSEVQDLLSQPNVTINPNAALNGKAAIELTFDGGRFTYWISASTYQPLQIEDRLFHGITRFLIARVLTGSAASPKLLSLEAQHPDAHVDHSLTDYNAALRRLHLNSRPPRRSRPVTTTGTTTSDG